MKVFTAEDFALICKFLQQENNIEFARMYDKIGLIGIVYAFTNYELAKSDFIKWYLSLNTDIKEKIILYIKEYYNS